jgi:hypothetical protein
VISAGLRTSVSVLGQSIPNVVRCKLDKLYISPLKLKVDYTFNDNLESVDLLVCYSLTSKLPTPDNCDRKLTNKPRVINIFAQDAHGKRMKNFVQVNSQWVYITFLSETGCTIDLTFLPEKQQQS